MDEALRELERRCAEGTPDESLLAAYARSLVQAGRTAEVVEQVWQGRSFDPAKLEGSRLAEYERTDAWNGPSHVSLVAWQLPQATGGSVVLVWYEKGALTQCAALAPGAALSLELDVGGHDGGGRASGRFTVGTGSERHGCFSWDSECDSLKGIGAEVERVLQAAAEANGGTYSKEGYF